MWPVASKTSYPNKRVERKICFCESCLFVQEMFGKLLLSTCWAQENFPTSHPAWLLCGGTGKVKFIHISWFPTFWSTGHWLQLEVGDWHGYQSPKPLSACPSDFSSHIQGQSKHYIWSKKDNFPKFRLAETIKGFLPSFLLWGMIIFLRNNIFYLPYSLTLQWSQQDGTFIFPLVFQNQDVLITNILSVILCLFGNLNKPQNFWAYQ